MTRTQIEILIRIVPGRIVPRSAVRHSGKDSDRDSNGDYPRQRCDAFWSRFLGAVPGSAVRHSDKDSDKDSNGGCPRERCDAFW